MSGKVRRSRVKCKTRGRDVGGSVYVGGREMGRIVGRNGCDLGLRRGRWSTVKREGEGGLT